MALYRDLQFNKGTVTDLMGAVGTVTGATFNKDKKGWALQTGSGKYVKYDRQLLPDGAFSVVAWVKMDKIDWVSRLVRLISNTLTGSLGIILNINYNGSISRPIIYLGSGNFKYFDWVADTKWHCFIFTIDGGTQTSINNAKMYVDNIERVQVVAESSGTPNARNTFVYTGGSNSVSPIGKYDSRIKVYDHVLTSKEREREQIEFEAAQPLTYQKRQLQLSKPTELKQQGLIAAYNKIRSGLYNDLSVSGKHGVITNCLSTVKGVRLHGINSKIVLGNIGNVKSISFRIKLKTTTQPILEKASNSGLIHVSNGTLTSTDFANKYINGVAGTTITANQWHNVTLTSSTDVNFSAATLGLNNTTYGAFEIEDLRFYSNTLSLQEIKAYHNSFNEVILQESFDDMTVGSSRLPNGWIKNGGSFVCGENTTNDPVIKLIRKGTKYLKCVTAGIVAIPYKQAYGTLEWDWYKGGDNNEMLFSITSPTIKGSLDTLNNYFISITTQESIGLIKNGGINWLFLTKTSYINNNTWYRIRITRTTSGVFTIYILGGNFTDWTLVSTTGGSGTNPTTDNTYTTSSYFVIDIDANDRVGNILIQSQIKV